MAKNPVIHNDGGVHRFADYVGQVPDFLKVEEDVVVLLQLMSDYVNNAYRNITTVEKFEFKFIAVDSNLTAVQNRVSKLIKLFKRCEERGEKVLYISKPQGNPSNSSRPLYMEYIIYAGKVDDVSPSLITIPISSVITGDKFYIKFTADGQESNSGVYVYNKITNTLTLDEKGFSQDPFTNTPDEPFKTVVGLAPRMIQFNVTDISNVYSHKAGIYNGLLYYDVFFEARISNVENVTSVNTLNADIDGDGELEKILIDYYGTIRELPVLYDESFSIKFASECNDFTWVNGYGMGLFYARDLTQYERTSSNTNSSNENRYVDPLYSPNTSIYKITNIKGIGSSKIELTIMGEHSLSKGDTLSIVGTDLFDGTDYTVTSIITTKTLQASTPTNIVGNESAGSMIVRNLYYSSSVDDVTRYKIKMPYKSFTGTTEFSEGDRIIRINKEYETVSLDFDSTSQAVLADDKLYFSRVDGFSSGDSIVFRLNDGGTLPTGISEGIIYEISEITDITVSSVPKKAIKLKDIAITAFGTSTDATISLVNRYFDSSNVDITNNTILLNSVDGLSVGTLIRFTGTSNNVSLPSPLVDSTTYRISYLDTTNKKISLEGITLETIPDSGIVFDAIKIIQNLYNVGIVEANNITAPLESGIATFRSVKGDMISAGEIYRLAAASNSTDIVTASIDSTAIAWVPTEHTTYYKGQLVVFRGVCYEVKTTHTIDSTVDTTPVNDTRYVVNMTDIITRYKTIKFNPYMFGLYSSKSLNFDETPDYNNGFSTISNDLYIRKTSELALKYGHDQREFLFDPRLVPPSILERNGFMEIINTALSNDAFDGDVTKFIKATTESSKILSGVTDIVVNVVNISRNGSTVTVITDTNHLFETGVNVIISGATPSDYNGTYTVTITGPKTFTYTIPGSPSTTITGTITATYTQKITREIVSLTRSGTIATVVLGSEHGYGETTLVTIEGADQAGYNGTFPITVIDEYTFEYTVTGLEVTPATTSSILTSTYTPDAGDFLLVANQLTASFNGTYIVKNGAWEKYDDSVIPVPVTIFARQNFFDVSDQNPSIAKELNKHKIRHLQYMGSRTVQVTTADSHMFIVGSIANITGAQDPLYNGRYPVDTVIDAFTFTYKIAMGKVPTTPDIGVSYAQSDAWYKYEITEIGWQKKSSYNSSYLGKTISNINGTGSVITVNTVIPHEFVVGDAITIINTTSFNGTYTINAVESSTRFTYIGSVIGTELVGNVYKGFEVAYNYNRDALPLLRGEYTFTKFDGSVYDFVDGDIVSVYDQYIPHENGLYRVQKNAIWKRLDKRLVMKVRNITVDAYPDIEYTGLEEDTSPYIYRRYSDSDVNDYIDANFDGFTHIYKVESTYAANYSFAFEVVDNIDTVAPLHRQYDAKYDYNSIADRSDMSSSFKGVADMKYPLVEKFERLAYLKDPNVIDFEMIEYLARYMGYDITMLYEDILESNVYLSDAQKESALRSTIENLPQYYSLKSTTSGLELLLLTFGIVGELVTLWTRQEDPYNELIPDYELRGLQMAESMDGKLSSFVPTPHFMVKVDIEGNFDNQLLPTDNQRITQQIKRFKPINDVFDGIIRYLKVKLSARIGSSPMKATGKMSGSIGYTNLQFEDEITNDCI